MFAGLLKAAKWFIKGGISVEIIFKIFTILGLWTIFITPLTLTVGIINAIKKPEKEAVPYIIMAVISAYLIIIPIIGILMKL